VSDQPFEPSPEVVREVDPDPEHDLAYDLAHEAGVAAPAARAPGEREAVVTATPEYDGDYSYDLAHDVPKA
jgi:hypothetical protein